jgi:hypothetical protein
MYFYEHTNGKIIGKIDYVVDSVGPYDYFDSPFVKRWWHEEDKKKIETNENPSN